MHIFLYEWATGGGLVEESGGLPSSLLREGAAMIGALVSDIVKIQDFRVTALRDPRALQLTLPHATLVDVLSQSSHWEEFERLTTTADATMIIAPEFDKILWNAARYVVNCGGRLLSPSPEFIRITGDKQQTCRALASAGVPMPHGTVLQGDEPLPPNFNFYPAVLKPVDGAGSQDTYLVTSPHDALPAYAWPRRLEGFVPGLAASVAVLCGPTCRVPLAPCRQRLSDDGRFRYLGGELPLAWGLAERASRLAERAVAALPPAVGYVGVDLVLGSDPTGAEDVVIEVNPRLTTSYVGLRAAAKSNLAQAIWNVANGETVNVEFAERPIEFDACGNVSFAR
jgi:predicted ATP-grasp superfamily ATP-dependent carboligase